MLRRPLLLLALAAATVLVVVLARQNRDLREQRDLLAERMAGPYAGMWMPEVTGRTLADEPVVLGAPEEGSAQVLLFFTTTCPHCRASLPSWRSIAERLSAEAPAAEVVGVSLDSLAETDAYVREHRLPFPVARLVRRRDVGAVRATSVPAVAVVDAEGRTVYARVGRMETEAAVDSVVAAARGALAPASGAPPAAEVAAGDPSPSTRRTR